MKKEDLKLYKSNISSRLYQRVLFSNKPSDFTQIEGTLGYFKKTPDHVQSPEKAKVGTEERRR